MATEVSGFSEFIQFMAGADAFTLLLPFLLSWMVYYIALEKASFIWDGKDSLQNFPPVIALFMAFFTARFIALNPFYQTFFIDFFGKITIGVIGILGLLTMLAFVGYEDKVINKNAFVVFILMAVGAAFIVAGGFGPPLIRSIGLSGVAAQATALLNWTLETGAIWAIVIGIMVWFIIKEPNTDDGDGNGTGVGLLDALLAEDVANSRIDSDDK